MTKFEKKSICAGVNFTCIHDSRFKTSRISATILMPLCRDTVSQNAILPFILRRSCKEYPTFKMLNQKLSELYGANLYSSVNKIGETQALTISVTGIDDRYSLDRESISQEITKLLCSIIFHPNLDKNNNFKEEDLSQEKRQLLELLDSEFNDKRTYSKLRCEEMMCQNEKFGINRLGTKEQVNSINCDNVLTSWTTALKNSRIELIMIGNSDPGLAYEVFKEAFSKISREFTPLCNTEVINSVKTVTKVSDKMDVSQCKLVMGFRAGVTTEKDINAMRVMSAIFGGTPHSKLFLNVREKMSLCYYCLARYDRIKGIILVESGVEKQNIEKAKQEILSQLDAIKNGEFTIDDIEATKMSISNNFKTLTDHLGGLENFYVSQAFDDKIYSPEELVEKINKVTMDEIISAANKVMLDTVFTLENKD